MSVNSNLLGMQGPTLSNPCASPQVQPMHSEAKMVNNTYNPPFVICWLFLLVSTLTSTFGSRQGDGSALCWWRGLSGEGQCRAWLCLWGYLLPNLAGDDRVTSARSTRGCSAGDMQKFGEIHRSWDGILPRVCIFAHNLKLKIIQSFSPSRQWLFQCHPSCPRILENIFVSFSTHC